MTMTTEEHIKKIINATFEAITEVYNYNVEDCVPRSRNRLLFPKKRGSVEIRISEQELRFVFVEQLLNHINECKGKWDVYYSVETPTRHGYIGFKEGKPEVDDIKGRSGNIDLCIHNSSGERICLIEFKALNPESADYLKDFCKLQNENEDRDDILRYFIQIVENVDSGTMNNIRKKIESDGNKHNRVIYKCYCLKKGEPQELITNNTK